jgi:hypothetical protein
MLHSETVCEQWRSLHAFTFPPPPLLSE